MKRLWLIALLLVAVAVPGCAGHLVIPEDNPFPEVGAEDVYDDVYPAPSPMGFIYRANIHYPDDIIRWPPIEFTQVTLKSWFERVVVEYRDYLETRAGETRHAIFMLARRGCLFKEGILSLYATPVPPGIELSQYTDTGQMGVLSAVLTIEISPDITLGQYNLAIGLEVKGRHYGTVTCIIEVVE